ncbi:MAG TPA: asparaginase [Candidatus Kapabacteria bacterium]|nr:asparaginase [Candidatus Kapabacteria bacterium]
MLEPIADANTSAEQQPASEFSSRIALIFTGGTIAVTTDKNAGPIPNLKGKQILERIPEVEKYLPQVETTVYDFSVLPGPQMSPSMMITLAEFVSAVLEECDGVVITHGTDSLEECAYLLDLVIDTPKPIVFTGAMHHSLDAGWDGGSNLIDAIGVAASAVFRNEGVLTVLNGAINSAAEVTKSHTSSSDTFRSMDFGPLGSVEILACIPPVKLRPASKRVHLALSEDSELPRVELFKTYTGMDDHLFAFAIKEGVQGIVVEAMGQGNVPPGALNGIARAREMHIPVVITSRCPSGAVRPYYAYEGAGRDLEKLGCLFAPYLNGQKARIKLMMALACGAGEELLKEIF